MDERKMKIAIHETGHAVTALLFGRELESVSLKGMPSPDGGDPFLGFVKVKPLDKNAPITFKEATSEFMIALGGYAGEMVVFDQAGIAENDLRRAIKWAKVLLQFESFKRYAEQLPAAKPGTLKMIEDDLVRAVVDSQLDECPKSLVHFGPAIQTLARTLYEKDELTGDQFAGLFYSIPMPV